MRLALFLLASPALALAPLPREVGGAAAVYRELGLPEPKDAADLPADYAADAVGSDDVKASPDKYPVRVAVLAALKNLKNARDTTRLDLTVTPADVASTAFGKQIHKLQERPAVVALELEEARDALARAAAKRDAEPSKRWRAHLDYATAEVEFRLALCHEYNSSLGHLRTQTLPDLDAGKGQTGWRLASNETMRGGRIARDTVESARKSFAAVAERHPGTPWAKLAEQSKATPAGLAWKPVVVVELRP